MSSALARRRAHSDRSFGVGTFRYWVTDEKGRPSFFLNKRGKKIYGVLESKNSITTEMAQLITQILSRTGTNASGPAGGLWTAGPYIGLTTVAVTVAMTLGTITEAVGNGYARVAPTWATVAGPPAGYNNNASAAVFGPASGGNLGGAALTTLFVTPASSGTGSAPNVKLIAFSALNGGPYTIVVPNSLNVTYSWTLT